MKIHQMEERPHFEELYVETKGFLENMLRIASKDSSDHQLAFHQLVTLSYRMGCISFILGKEEGEIRRCFREAAGYGVKLLAAKAPRGSTGFRSFEVDLEASHDGALVGAEIRERNFPPDERKLSVDKFVSARMAITTFGDMEELIQLGHFPEEEYANPNVIPESGTLEDLRARKAWLRGDRVQARRESEAALSRSSNARVRPSIETFLALVDGDVASFEDHLVDVLKQHAKYYKKYPHVPEGVVCFPGIELCRLALDGGFPIDEQPYLPIRFLPNYRAA